MEDKMNYSVWVGGIEVNDYYLDKDEADLLVDLYKHEGYKDVVIEEVL